MINGKETLFFIFVEHIPLCSMSYIINILVIFFILSDSPVSEFYMPTFRNTLFNLHRRCK
jgi:hypothetical protein